MKTLADLYDHMLRDVYHAEKQVKKLLPKLARAVANEDLGERLARDLVDIAARLECVETAFAAIEKRPKTIPCEAMIGLIKEGEEVLEDADDDAVDAGVIAAYQAIKHYEITRFGTLGAWSNRLGDMKMASKFGAIVDECKMLDEQLTVLAEAKVNPKADDNDPAESANGGTLKQTKGAKTGLRPKNGKKPAIAASFR